MRKVNLKSLFESKGGEIKDIGGFPYKCRADGCLIFNPSKEKHENEWKFSSWNGWRPEEKGILDGLWNVKVFESVFGFTPKNEFIVEVK